MKVRLCLLALVFGLLGCYSSYYLEKERWVYFEDWDADKNLEIDSMEFVNGYLVEAKKFNKKLAPDSAGAMFIDCDEDKDGKIGSLEFYRWEIDL